MIDKFVRSIVVGLVVASATLVGFGWKAYSRVSEMGKEIKAEVKAEMVEIRNRDMEYIGARFDLVEKIVAGRVVNEKPIPQAEQ
jgi:hypothetical protein